MSEFFTHCLPAAFLKMLKAPTYLRSEASLQSTTDKKAQAPPRVLMVGPGPLVRGGITTVIRTYEEEPFWEEHACTWLSTYEDTSNTRKIYAAVSAWLRAPVAMLGRDVVHIHAAFRTSFFRKLFIVILAKLLRKRVLFHVHEPNPSPVFRSPIGFLVRAVLSFADCVVALTPYWATEFARECPRARIEELPNPIRMPLLIDESCAEQTSNILFVGKLEPRKGVADLVTAMSLVLKEVPDATLTLAGHGDISGVCILAQRLGIGDKVRCLGWVDSKSEPSVFRGAAVFCLPSYHEGLPMAVLEAMSYALPVVVTPVGGVPDLVHSGVNGLLVKAGDVVAIASAIVRLLQDSKLRTSLGTAARLTVERFYRSDRVCARLSELYARLRR